MVSQVINWRGRVKSVQPRVRLYRSFDQVMHQYQGYVLEVAGEMAGEALDFLLALGKATQAKHKFQAGVGASGSCQPVVDPKLEQAGYYKASRLKILQPGPGEVPPGPPWQGVPPALEVYRERGYCRLDARVYNSRCKSCIWGCRMPVEMIIDQWDQQERRYRYETFCYGPKSCPVFRPGPPRKVPGRKGMVYVEEDWVYQDLMAHRGDDE